MRRPTRPSRVPAALGATLLVATLSLSACGSDDPAGQADGSGSRAADATATPTPDAGQGSSAAGSASASPTKPTKPAGTTIDITITKDSVKPNGDRVKAKLGQPITLKIQAEAAGELHVHSTPEQEIEFPAGSSTKKLTIEQPGVVDVEDHALEQVIVQLQVS